MSSGTIFIIVAAVIVAAVIAYFIFRMAHYSDNDPGEAIEDNGDADIITDARTYYAPEKENDHIVFDESDLDETAEAEEYDDNQWDDEDEYYDDSETDTESPTPEEIMETHVDWGSDEDGYEILRSGTFRIKGIMENEGKKEPVEIAITPDSVYMSALFEDVVVGLLVRENTVYMISDRKHLVLKLSQLVMKAAGIDTSSLSAVNVDMFDDMPEKEEADEKNPVTMGGKECTEYVFNKEEGGCRKVIMDGNHVLSFANYGRYGELSAEIEIQAISGEIPENLVYPNSEYRQLSGMTGAARFIAAVAPDAKGE